MRLELKHPDAWHSKLMKWHHGRAARLTATVPLQRCRRNSTEGVYWGSIRGVNQRCSNPLVLVTPTGIAFVHQLDPKTSETRHFFVKSYYPFELLCEQVKERLLSKNVAGTRYYGALERRQSTFQRRWCTFGFCAPCRIVGFS